MPQANPINVFDTKLIAVSETTFGTTPTPASIAAYALLALEHVSTTLGAAAQPDVRDKKDRSLGRGMRSGFVQGRTPPGDISVELSIKSRAAVDTALKELALYKAAGLKATTNAGVSVVLSTPADPIASGDFASATLEVISGAASSVDRKEIARGCVVKSLSWMGGDQELMLSVNGSHNGNKTTQGSLESITVIIGATTLSHSAEESYRLQPGYYFCEAEVILVGAVTAGSTSTGITRAQLGTSAAGHTSRPLVPLLPAGIAFTGSPIGEPVSTVTIDGVAIRCVSFGVELTTGLDHLQGETGSAFIQGVKLTRYDVKPTAKLVLKGDDMALLGKATARKLVAVSFTQGTAGGGRVTFSMPYCEIEAPSIPDSANDVAIVDLVMRCRDSAGNDAITITFD